MAQASKSKTSSKPSGAAKKPGAKGKTPAKKSPAAVQAAPARAKPKAKVKAPPLVKLVEQALSDIKAMNVAVFDVRELTDVTDTMIIASGNSDRHVRSIADRVIEAAKKAGFRPMGVEGERDGEWVLVDLQDLILHVMLPRVREVYRLENLWDISTARREAAQA